MAEEWWLLRHLHPTSKEEAAAALHVGMEAAGGE